MTERNKTLKTAVHVSILGGARPVRAAGRPGRKRAATRNSQGNPESPTGVPSCRENFPLVHEVSTGFNGFSAVYPGTCFFFGGTRRGRAIP